jgi:hypothetical protein
MGGIQALGPVFLDPHIAVHPGDRVVAEKP